MPQPLPPIPTLPLTLTDQMGRRVVVPYPPRRIVSLVPSQTELLFDLGVGERVVGVTKFCIHPSPGTATGDGNWRHEKFRLRED